MSKYSPLWEFAAAQTEESFSLSFDEIEALLGFPIDHSFLTYKKELSAFGRRVKKISVKEQRVFFTKD